MKQYNIYCDESCHLENDNQNVMVLGAVWVPHKESKRIYREIRDIKIKHNLSKYFEIKWTKVSNSKIDFYSEIIDYFFMENNLHFRALIIPSKKSLDHDLFDQDHNTWYYKMYFNLLKVIFESENSYNIYLDIKDTNSIDKVKKLHDVLCNNMYDFSKDRIKKIQNVRSHEIEILQITDLFIGAISYINRGLSGNEGKEKIISQIKNTSKYSLLRKTQLNEKKFNLFFWKAQNGE